MDQHCLLCVCVCVSQVAEAFSHHFSVADACIFVTEADKTDSRTAREVLKAGVRAKVGKEGRKRREGEKEKGREGGGTVCVKGGIRIDCILRVFHVLMHLLCFSFGGTLMLSHTQIPMLLCLNKADLMLEREETPDAALDESSGLDADSDDDDDFMTSNAQVS